MTMSTAISICLIFWAVVISLMAYWRRSWVNLLVFPLLLSCLILGLDLWSPSVAFWFSAGLHGGISTFLIYVAVFRRKSHDDPFQKRGRDNSDNSDTPP
jgi:hypothetical protein